MKLKTLTRSSPVISLLRGRRHDTKPARRFPGAILALGLLAVACVVAGCANRYVVVTTNGTQITSKGKPKLVDGYYQFEDTLGRQMSVPALRVREITPASMANEEQEGKIFTPQTKTVR